MAGAKRRSPTSTLVSKGSIQKAGNALGDLPAKPKEIWSLREAIDALKDQITLALDRGYTYPEISEMLTARGVEISASTLKYYLSAVKRQDPNSKPRRRRRTLGASLSAESLSLSLGGDAPKKRGRQPKAAKAAAPAVTEKKKPGRKPKAAAAAPVATTAKKKPGRPPKAAAAAKATVTTEKKKPGRKPKAAAAPVATTAKKKPGRPPKAAAAKATATKTKTTKGTGRGRKKASA